MDPYQILDLEYGVDSDQLRVRYRELARELHPDNNPEDPDAVEKFQQLQEAYQLIREGTVVLSAEKINAGGILNALFNQPRQLKVRLPADFFERSASTRVVQISVDDEPTRVSIPGEVGFGDIVFIARANLYLELVE